jgi:hypothetical protein
MTSQPENNSPDSNKHSTFSWPDALLVILFVIGTPFIRHIHTTKLFEILNPFIPACVCFRPFFLLFGILFRTSTKPTKAPWLALSLLIAGTAMITLSLIYFLSKLPVS